MKRLRTKEKIGLHPVMMILLLCLIVIVVSGIFRFFNVQATFNKVVPATNEFQVTSEAVNSLFSLRGLKYIFTSTVKSFANYAVLSHLIIILIGIGVMVKSRFLRTTILLLTKKAKKTTVTYVLVLLCILASIIGNLSYIILIPLSALLFHYGKRNPMIGIVASYAALTCGSALSIFITSIDSSLLTYTLNNAYIFNSVYSISSFSYLLVMPILIVILSLLITNIVENFVAKRLPKYDFLEEELAEEEFVLTRKAKRGLVMALLVSIVYLLIFIYNIIPGLPLSGNLLDYTQTLYIDKLFSVNSFFNNGFVFVVAVWFILLGLSYGIGARTINNNKEFVEAMGEELNGIGKVLVMIFVASAFINIFKQSNIGNVVIGLFTSIISNASVVGLPLVILLFIFSMIGSMLVPNATSSWAILSGVVPTFMQANITPEFTQLIFRLGSSIAIGITPIFAYFIVYLAYLEKYNQDTKPITLKAAIRYQIPFVVVTGIVYLLFIVLWFILGFPLGIGSSIAL